MAARKSCTKMTWAEAKAKCGESSSGGSKNPNRATLKISQQPNHGKLLAAKILAKSGPTEDQRVKNRQAAKTARKDRLRQEELDRRREAEKERKKLEDVVKPHEMAIEKRKDVEARFHDKLAAAAAAVDGNGNGNGNSSDDDDDEPERRYLVCESKELQVDEVLALEAIYAADEDDDNTPLRVSEASRPEILREKLERWQEDPDGIDAQRAVVGHPGLSYTLRRSIDDPSDDDRVAHLLIHVAYPGDYPLETTPPGLEIVWFHATQKSLVVSSNKPLESSGVLDEAGLLDAMATEARDSLGGMPVVYELLDTWLGEHLFEFVRWVPDR